MQEQLDQSKSKDDSLKNLFIFQDLFAFARDHTGLTFTIAYLTLILSSMTYLHVLYGTFDISIVKFVSLEDILATPIKNPDIIVVFLAIIFVLFLSELGNRWNVKSREKYQGKEVPLWVKFIRIAVWVPKSRKANIQFTLFISIVFFATYIVMFAQFEAERIQEGRGSKVTLTLSDSDEPFERALLGATSQFIFTYDLKSKESSIYHIENILMMQPVVERPSTDSKIEVKTPEDSTEEQAKLEPETKS